MDLMQTPAARPSAHGRRMVADCRYDLKTGGGARLSLINADRKIVRQTTALAHQNDYETRR